MTRKAGRPSGKDWRRRREAVTRRDGTSCHWFGVPDAATLDHVVPSSAGGSHRIDNLVLACEPCNQARGGVHGPGAWDHLVGKPCKKGDR